MDLAINLSDDNRAKEHEHDDPATDRFEGTVAEGAQGASGEGEGDDAAAGRAGAGAAGAAVGARRGEVRLRYAAGEGEAGGALPREEPVDRVSLHVRAGLGGRVPELFVRVGPPERGGAAPVGAG